MVAAFALALNHLGHGGLYYWDESFHAVVARNVLKHPLRPTLVDVPYIPYDLRNWDENHVWLHKPILPFWVIALSYACLGVNTLALRLPSALLAAGSVGLTVAIGEQWFDRRTGLVAGALQAANPSLIALVHGYQFGDHVDAHLLFFTELGVFFLAKAIDTGSRGATALAGLAQGLGYLSKSYPAAIISALALVAWLLPRFRPELAEGVRLRLPHVLVVVVVSLVVVAPWTVFCAVNYPREFAWEHGYVFGHLVADIERWGAPWDRLFFDYLIFAYDVFYTPILIAFLAQVPALLRSRGPGPWLTYAWLVGVHAPFTLAATKTPMTAAIAMPAAFLLLGRLVADASRGLRWPALALLSVVAVGLAEPAVVQPPGRGYPENYEFGAIAQSASWVVWHVLAALDLALLLEAVFRVVPGAHKWWGPLAWLLAAVTAAGLLVLGVRYAWTAWETTQQRLDRPSVYALASYVRTRLPPNAVLIFAGAAWQDHQLAMLLTDRTCYRLKDQSLDQVARGVIVRGGSPYVVLNSPPPRPVAELISFADQFLYPYRAPERFVGPGGRAP